MAVMGNVFFQHRRKYTEGNWNISLQRMHSLSVIAGGIRVSSSSFFLPSSFLPSFPFTSRFSCTYLHRSCSFFSSIQKERVVVSLIQFFRPPLFPPSNLFSLSCCLSSQEKESAAVVVISERNFATVGLDYIYAGLSLQMVEG